MKRALAVIALAAIASARPARADGLWKPVPAPSAYRGGYGIARLKDDRVMVVGGAVGSAGEQTKQVAIFDPKTESWSDAAPMNTARVYHATVQLTTGEVLVAGGGLYASSGAQTSTAELYDPTTNAWTALPPLRAPATADGVRLTDGRIAVMLKNASSPAFELFDPTTRAWTIAATPTQVGAIAPLAGGDVLSVSGYRVERFSTTSGWTRVTIPSGTLLTFPMALADGNVLVFSSSSVPEDPYLFEAATGKWLTITGNDRQYKLGVRLSDGREVVAGPLGSSAFGVQIFDPKTRTFGSTIEAPSAYFNGGIGLADGRALFIGMTGSVGQAYLFSPPTKCSADSECPTGHCADGLCCDTACNGQCEACDVATSVGTCVGINGAPHGTRAECSPSWTPACRALGCDAKRSRTACVAPVFAPPCDCTRDDECSSGHCADGVCCNTACDGQCEACDLPDARGVCVPVSGEPRGIRKGCDPPGRLICSVQACDGKNARECVFVHGAETDCDSICGGRLIRHCNGEGLCGRPERECPDNNGCSVPPSEPSPPPRYFDAFLIVALAALVKRARR